MGQGGQQGGNRSQSFGRDYSAVNDGSLRGPEGNGRNVQQAYTEALRELNRLQESAESPETREEAARLIRRMEQLDPSRFAGNPALLERLRGEIVPGLEDLELLLRRDVEKNQQGQVRSGSGAKVPPKYAEAVAEYYRKLSRGK
jgi:hypothetical protein